MERVLELVTMAKARVAAIRQLSVSVGLMPIGQSLLQVLNILDAIEMEVKEYADEKDDDQA